MGDLNQLKPSRLWYHFEEICKIPRISKQEEKIRRYLLRFAETNHLESKVDDAGNVLIIKPPANGMDNKKTVVLQSHLDMVGEKNASTVHNWETDSIKPLTDGRWVSAEGTTLGADDGIGIAAQLSVLEDINLSAGRIECLFTVDEETGMTGAINLNPDFITGKTLLNLDSEDEGILFIGCAGGMDTVGTMSYEQVPSTLNSCAIEISVTGLHGGHSGDEIHKGYANSVKIMGRILKEISKHHKIAIHDFNGGNLRNAIPREAFSTIVTGLKDCDNIKSILISFLAAIRNETGDLEKNLAISFHDVEMPAFTMDRDCQNRFLEALDCCPHGVLAWSKDMEDLVETSTNLASAKFSEENIITIVTSQRSSVESSKREAAAMVEKCLKAGGAKVSGSGGYPGWKPDMKSEIMEITRKSYKRLFSADPVIRSIHAGLECGMFFEKIAGIDMISFGPTIKGAHTPEEKIEIATVARFWDLLTDVLKNIPEKV